MEKYWVHQYVFIETSIYLMLVFWCYRESWIKIKIIIALEKGSNLEELIFKYTTWKRCRKWFPTVKNSCRIFKETMIMNGLFNEQSWPLKKWPPMRGPTEVRESHHICGYTCKVNVPWEFLIAAEKNSEL